MAIATTTALAIAGTAIAAGSSGMSFAQSAKQKRLQRQAESDAAKYMAEARKKLDVNFYEALGIQKEPYELERMALLSAGAQAVEAGRESERGAAAVAGRVQAQQQIGQRQIAGAMGQELMNLEKLTAQEESRLRDAQANLDLGAASGAQQAASVAEARSAQALQQGIQSAGSAIQQGLSFVPLYQKSASTKSFEGAMKAGQSAGFSQKDIQNQFANIIASNPQEFGNIPALGGMNPLAFNDAILKMSPEQIRQISSQYQSGLKQIQGIGGQQGVSMLPYITF
jgi:hypothetical protein